MSALPPLAVKGMARHPRTLGHSPEADIWGQVDLVLGSLISGCFRLRGFRPGAPLGPDWIAHAHADRMRMLRDARGNLILHTTVGRNCRE